ncbi:hypothetical protein LM599_03710 [Candidatus Acetothermia bacterium]|jgi:hypothetical protein|nr:hypothetical protein [Candidatus Acetothermia bacterium]
MKGLISILTITAVIIGISVVGFPVSATQNVTVGWNIRQWIILFIPDYHRTVALTLGGGVADVAAGTLHPLTHHGTFGVWVHTNAPGFILTVSATATVPDGVTPGAVLSRFEIQGADLGTTWTPIGVGSVTLATHTTAGSFHADNIAYRFRVVVTDPPGHYRVTIIYTATTQ